MEFQDRQITCIDCNQPFVFTAGEQEFYKKKGFREEPKRCKACRAARNARRQGQAMEGLDGGPRDQPSQDDDLGNRIDASPRRGGGRPGPREPREMFDAVCAQCGGAARVPFRPAPGRPVYCRECFSSRAGAAR